MLLGMLIVAASKPSESGLPEVGIPLGLLIGGLSGALSLSFLRALQIARGRVGDVLQLGLQLIGIPALWLSAPFGSRMLASVDPKRLATSYVITLAAVWIAMLAWPLVRLVIATGSEIDSDDR